MLAVLACAGRLLVPGVLAEEPTALGRVEVPAMRTGIYVGSVTLSTSPLVRSGDSWSGTYDARVFPWAFWSEHGEIAITLAQSDLERVLRGETVEFAGEAHNHKGKPRSVSGRATPSDSHAGRIKVRIRVDGIELIFNGNYTLLGENSGGPATSVPAAAAP